MAFFMLAFRTDRSTLASEYGAYFTALTTACGDLVNAAVGASDLSAAIESYQNAYYEKDATLNSGVASAFITLRRIVRGSSLFFVRRACPKS